MLDGAFRRPLVVLNFGLSHNMQLGQATLQPNTALSTLVAFRFESAASSFINAGVKTGDLAPRRDECHAKSIRIWTTGCCLSSADALCNCDSKKAPELPCCDTRAYLRLISRASHGQSNVGTSMHRLRHLSMDQGADLCRVQCPHWVAASRHRGRRVPSRSSWAIPHHAVTRCMHM